MTNLRFNSGNQNLSDTKWIDGVVTESQNYPNARNILVEGLVINYLKRRNYFCSLVSLKEAGLSSYFELYQQLHAEDAYYRELRERSKNALKACSLFHDAFNARFANMTEIQALEQIHADSLGPSWAETVDLEDQAQQWPSVTEDQILRDPSLAGTLASLEEFKLKFKNELPKPSKPVKQVRFTSTFSKSRGARAAFKDWPRRKRPRPVEALKGVKPPFDFQYQTGLKPFKSFNSADLVKPVEVFNTFEVLQPQAPDLSDQSFDSSSSGGDSDNTVIVCTDSSLKEVRPSRSKKRRDFSLETPTRQSSRLADKIKKVKLSESSTSKKCEPSSVLKAQSGFNPDNPTNLLGLLEEVRL
jgi:hypothetical protein